MTEYPYPLKFAHLPDGKMAYIDEGKGKNTLLFVHGLGSSLPAWRKNIDDLKRDFRCIAVDLLGYGQSSQGDYTFTMRFFTKILRDFIQTLGLKNIVLVGHSMGAQIVLTLALDAKPLDLNALILVAPAGIERFSPEEAMWLRAIYMPELIKSASTEQIKKSFDINFAAGNTPEDAMFMYYDRLELRENPRLYDAYCKMIPKCVMGMLEAPVFDKLPKLELPVLAIFGEQDYLIPNRYLHPMMTIQTVASATKTAIPNSTVFKIQNAGHFVMWDKAAVVNDRIKFFLG
jgi:pimeloyl-ACP methyl ester carboxylesterase